MTPSASGPEQKARAQIDAALVAAGWIVQDRDEMDLSGGSRRRRTGAQAHHGLRVRRLSAVHRRQGRRRPRSEAITVNIKGESYRLREKLKAGLLKPKLGADHGSDADVIAAQP